MGEERRGRADYGDKAVLGILMRDGRNGKGCNRDRRRKIKKKIIIM